ncbi:MAG: hypothetical protein ABIP12_06410 [Terriglobales bacterium]
MARDLSRFRLAHRNEPENDQYEESHYLPPEVAAYLQRTRRRPYVMRGILAGSLIALAGLWVIYEVRRRRQPVTAGLPTMIHAAL